MSGAVITRRRKAGRALCWLLCSWQEKLKNWIKTEFYVQIDGFTSITKA